MNEHFPLNEHFPHRAILMNEHFPLICYKNEHFPLIATKIATVLFDERTDHELCWK